MDWCKKQGVIQPERNLLGLKRTGHMELCLRVETRF